VNGRLFPGVVVAAGFVMCATAWWNAGGENRLEDQTGAIWLGVAGLAVAVLGEAAWLRSDRRALSAYRGRLLQRAGGLGHAVVPAFAAAGEELVAVDGMQRYHRAGCPIARLNPGTAAPRATHESSGRQPCGICQP
jgi:hypothetical protein